ncbi:MAG: ATP-binding protein [archaeon]|nr:ATP-binding protein [archaeon]
MNQINVVGGVNASGKSTLSKVLYSFLVSLSEEGNQLANSSIYRKLELLIYRLERFKEDENTGGDEIDEIYNKLVSGKYKEALENLSKIYKESLYDTYSIREFERIKRDIEINESDDKYNRIMIKVLSSEFEVPITDSKIKFSGALGEKEFIYSLHLKNRTIKKPEKGSLKSVIPTVVYIDFLSILDLRYNSSYLSVYPKIRTNKPPFHIQDLLKKLMYEKEEIDVYDESSEEIIELKKKLEKIINGRIKFNFKERKFIYKTDDDEYNMSHTASGIKQIGILQNLLNKDILKENGFVFIDEPEVNLHPEWQVALAEIIILLSKELNIIFYINSHSPFFIEAMEVYSEHYDISDKINFYLAEKYEKNKYDINKISRKELDKIYDNLGDPFNTLNRIRFENEYKNEEYL